jgi:RNA polymerase sigma factor (sigma-70 family)
MPASSELTARRANVHVKCVHRLQRFPGECRLVYEEQMDSKNDAELVHLSRAGNRDAYSELVRRYQRSISSLASLLVSDPFEAEDLAQEAFLRAWLNLDLLSDPAKFAPWLRRIAFGVSIDWLRVFRPDLYRLPDSKTDLALSDQSAHNESGLERLQAVELRQRIRVPVAADALSPGRPEQSQSSRSTWLAGKYGAFTRDARTAKTTTNACLLRG